MDDALDHALDDALLAYGDLDSLFSDGPMPDPDAKPALVPAPGGGPPVLQPPVYSGIPQYAPPVLNTAALQAQQTWAFAQQQVAQQQAQVQQAPAPRKRGRPKGSGANVSPQVLQEQLERKLAELEYLRKENEILSHKKTMLEMVVQARDEQTLRVQLLQAGKADEALALAGLDAKSIMSMSLREMAQKTKELMVQIGGVLLHMELKGDKEQFNRTIRNLEEGMKYGLLLRPDAVILAGRDVTESSRSVEDSSIAPAAHWHEVVLNMNLTPEQCHQSWVLYELYLRWHAKLLSERGVTNAALGQILSVRSYGQVYQGEHLTTAADQVLLDKLHASLVSERCLMVLVTEVYRSRLLTEEQHAKMFIHSHPYCLDGIAILSASAALHGPPQGTHPQHPHPNTAAPLPGPTQQPYNMTQAAAAAQSALGAGMQGMNGAYNTLPTASSSGNLGVGGCGAATSAGHTHRAGSGSSSSQGIPHMAHMPVVTTQPPVLPPSPLIAFAQPYPTQMPGMQPSMQPGMQPQQQQGGVGVGVGGGVSGFASLSRVLTPQSLETVEFIPGSIVLNHALSSGGSDKLGGGGGGISRSTTSSSLAPPQT